MKTVYFAYDGKEFYSKEECEKYEAQLALNENNIIQCFTSYGSRLKKYDGMHTDIVYIKPENMKEASGFLKLQHRDITGESIHNIYMLRSMCFYPIEEAIEQKREQQERIERDIKEIEYRIKTVGAQMKEEL